MPEVRLIDANALKNDIDSSYVVFGQCVYAKGIVDRQPTIEAEPVRHGRWIKEASDMFDCSEYGESIYWIFCEKKCSYGYCPNCGAKMDGGADND